MIDNGGRTESAVLYRKPEGYHTEETFLYNVQFLNKSAKSFVIFHQLFQSAEKKFFLQSLNNMDKTCTILQICRMYTNRLRMNLYN